MKVEAIPNRVPIKVGDLVIDRYGSIGVIMNEDKVVVLSFPIVRNYIPYIAPMTDGWVKFDGTVTLSND